MKKSLKQINFVIVLISIMFNISGCNKNIEDNEIKVKKNNTKATVKLDWYIQASWYNKKWDPKITLFDKIVTEKTGVDLNIIIPPVSGDEKLIAMASSGNLPDIITIDNWNSVKEQMIKSGYFLPLNDLAQKYSPELLNIIPDSMKKWYTQEDGNWYGIANQFIAKEWLSENSFIENPNGIIARKDIMDKLEIKPEDFNTQNGAIKALKKVKESNIKFNGQKVLPFYFQWNDWAISRMWGIPWETPDGNWIDFRTHPKYLEIYKFLNKLWREGLILEENFTNWAGGKIKQGICFAYLGNFDDISNVLYDSYKIDNKAVFVPVGPIHANDGSIPLYDQAGTGWTSTYITTKSKHPDKAIELLTFLSSDEGQMLTCYGVEGKTFEIVDGKVKYTNEYLTMKKEDTEMAKKVYGINDFWPLKQQLFYEKTINTKYLPEEEKNYKNIVNYFSKYAIHTPETMGILPEEGSPEAGILQKINDYWENQSRKMILAKSEKDVENIYNESIKYINKIGYQRVYDLSNAKFKAQKKKIGKEFSYPGNVK